MAQNYRQFHLPFFQPETYNRFASLGITILQGYGLTETSPVLCGTRLGASGPDHVGLPMRQVEVGIFNDAGEKLSQGQEGEIWARGPSVFRGYGEESQNKGVFFNDWFRTGDLGTLDSQGFLRITGRKKDIIVTAAGKNVYPEEIESSLIKTGKFIEVCALGMSDSAGHENVCVVVYPDPAKFARMPREQLHLNVEDSVRLVCNGLSEYKRPSHIYVVEHEVPKTSTRKIKKHEVKKLLLVGSANANTTADSGAGSLDLENSLESALANAIAPIAHLDPEKMRLSQHLSRDLRLDSLTLVEVLSVIENQFGQKLGEFETAELQTLEDLLLYLRRNLGTGKKRTKVFFSDFSPKQNRWPIFSFPRFLLIACLKLILRLFWNLRVEGLEHLPVRGALLFAPNHTSHFDTLAIQAALPFKRMQRNHPVAAKDYFFNRPGNHFSLAS
jgi:long-chain acyl-CoA synthetase